MVSLPWLTVAQRLLECLLDRRPGAVHGLAQAFDPQGDLPLGIKDRYEVRMRDHAVAGGPVLDAQEGSDRTGLRLGGGKEVPVLPLQANSDQGRPAPGRGNGPEQRGTNPVMGPSPWMG